MANVVLEFPDTASSVDEGLERIKQMAVKEHKSARHALVKATDYARTGCAADAVTWGLEASDAHRRAAILEDAWEKVAGVPWNTDWGMPD